MLLSVYGWYFLFCFVVKLMIIMQKEKPTKNLVGFAIIVL